MAWMKGWAKHEMLYNGWYCVRNRLDVDEAELPGGKIEAAGGHCHQIRKKGKKDEVELREEAGAASSITSGGNSTYKLTSKEGLGERDEQ